MNTDQVLYVLRKISAGHTVGVYASDMLPKDVKKPAALVINDEPHDQPGNHWYALYLPNNKQSIFFDSYGRKPPENILKFLSCNSAKYIYNKKTLQDMSSIVCGQYCILFLLFAINKFKLPVFLSLFTDNTRLNDETVFELYQYLLKKL